MIIIFPPALCSFTRSYVSIGRRIFPGEGPRNILMGELSEGFMHIEGSLCSMVVVSNQKPMAAYLK
jgi:hypothetical protein